MFSFQQLESPVCDYICSFLSFFPCVLGTSPLPTKETVIFYVIDLLLFENTKTFGALKKKLKQRIVLGTGGRVSKLPNYCCSLVLKSASTVQTDNSRGALR